MALLPSLGWAQALSCKSLFSAKYHQRQMIDEQALRKEAMELLHEIEKIENEIASNRRFNGNLERVTVHERSHRILQLKYFISHNEVGRALDLFSPTFRDVEISFHVIQRNRQKIEALIADHDAGRIDAPALKRLKKALERENAEGYQRLGRSYGDYYAVRTLLEEIIQKGTVTDPNLEMAGSVVRSSSSLTAEQILDGMGSSKAAGLFPGIGILADRPALKSIKQLLATTPEIYLDKIIVEARRERNSAIFRLSSSLVDIVYKLINKTLKPQWVEPVSNLFNLSYDAKIHKMYMPLIEEVIDIHNPARQLDELMRYSIIHNSHELLVTFARVLETRHLWPSLKKLAEVRGGDSFHDRIFAEKMQKAEDEAIHRSPLSLYHMQSGATRTGIILSSLATGAMLIYFQWTPETLDVLMGLKESLMSVAKGALP